MALITCPECGRENVSDSAEACPSCGYNIKKHINSNAEDERAVVINENNIPDRKPSVDSSKNKKEFIFTALIASSVIGIIFSIVVSFSVSFLYLFVVAAFAVLLAYSVKNYIKITGGTKRASSVGVSSKTHINTPRCPVCGSSNTERISTASRVVSTYMVGLASAKIGKQYKCNNCKHMW